PAYISPLALHDALPISRSPRAASGWSPRCRDRRAGCRAPLAGGWESPSAPSRRPASRAPRATLSCRFLQPLERRQLRGHQITHARPERPERDEVHHFAGERIGEQAPRCLLADAARAQIEQRVLVEL